jgi:hypothetical protein
LGVLKSGMIEKLNNDGAFHTRKALMPVMKLMFHAILPCVAWILWLMLSLQNFAIPAALGVELNWHEVVWRVVYVIPMILFFIFPARERVSVKCMVLFSVFALSQILRQSLNGSRDAYLEGYVIAIQAVVVVVMGFRCEGSAKGVENGYGA